MVGTADPKRPVAVWTEKGVIDNEPVNTLVLILRSKGCFWSTTSGCLMCGYNNDCLDSITAEDLLDQFTFALTQHADQPYLKIYTSGSFLDPNEIPPKVQEQILETAGKRHDRILVESRPEFISTENVAIAVNHVKTLEVAIGLESSSDRIRTDCINKGFDFAGYSKACDILENASARIRTYLLLKPPFLTEKEAIRDVLESIEKVKSRSETISVNPVNVQKGTVVEKLWRKGQYRTPWLWSLVDILTRTKTNNGARVISAPSGAGTKRGVHNCGKCDRYVMNAVKGFNIDQNPEVFKSLTCGCREEWLDLLDIEKITGSTGNLSRLSRP
jgi:radical SAM enzyme (TIGR01210 family)